MMASCNNSPTSGHKTPPWDARYCTRSDTDVSILSIWRTMTSAVAQTSMPKPRKKREAFGSLRKLPSGRQQASYTGPDGVRYSADKTFPTMTDARGWLSRMRTRIDEGSWTVADARGEKSRKDAKGVQLGDLMVQYIADRSIRKSPLTLRSRREYERKMKKELLPLMHMRIPMIVPEDINEWYFDIYDDGTWTKAARAYELVRATLNYAIRKKMITTNPCEIVGGSEKNTGIKVLPPSGPEEMDGLYASLPRVYHSAIDLATWATARWGELTELRRSDFVILRDKEGVVEDIIVKIHRGVITTVEDGYVVGKTKSEAGVRDIYLPPFIFNDVLEHLDERVGEADDALFYTAVGTETHLPRSTFNTHWDKARIAIGRPDLHFHALRHYGATKYGHTGATAKEIMGRAGHKTMAASMIYQHSGLRDRELAHKLER